MPAKLYLIPTLLSDKETPDSIARETGEIVKGLRLFLVENPKSARRFLKTVSPAFPLQECTFFELSEHTRSEETKKFLTEHKGQDVGIMSEAGCPCVADPGADVVRWAHEHALEVVPLAGPSSVVLALMASGLNGQNFAFNGYLPKDKNERLKKIKELEKRSVLEGQTQIVMETPYRNQSLFEDLLGALNAATRVCVASDLTSPKQLIRTQTTVQWRKEGFKPDKVPTLFLFLQD